MSFHGVGFVTATLCVTEAQKAAAIQACKAVQVKGLGASDPCALAQLPICGPLETPVDDTTTPDEGKKTLMLGGILLLVVGLGGYALYRGVK